MIIFQLRIVILIQIPIHLLICRVQADRNRILQVLNNLISNACKYSSGSIEIKVEKLDCKSLVNNVVHQEVAMKNDYTVMFTVIDHGM